MIKICLNAKSSIRPVHRLCKSMRFSSASSQNLRKIDLRSDTVTVPNPKMLDAMFKADVGDDVYSEDPTVNALQKKVADMLDKEDALFMPTGTQSNLCAIGAHCQRGDEIILGDNSHIFYYEGGGASAFMGVAMNIVPNQVGGDMDLDDVKSRIREYNFHYPRSSVLCVENTHNRMGGALLDRTWLKEARNLCDEHSLELHMDGARLWNAAVAQNCSVKDLVSDVDTVSVCLSKGLGAPVGSVLVGPKDFIEKAKFARKALGGGLRQCGYLAAAGIYALDENIERLAEDHRRIRELAKGIGEIEGVTMPNIESIQTNIVFFDVPKGLNRTLASHLKEEYNIFMGSYGDNRLRMVTHLGINDEDVEYVVNAMKISCRKLMS